MKRLDLSDENIRNTLMPHCRLKPGEVWHDPKSGHIVGCGDCTDTKFIQQLTDNSNRATLAIQDPPYNVAMFELMAVSEYIESCQRWINNSANCMTEDAALYIWMGADQKNHFQPLPQFMAMMAGSGFDSKSFITMRNQRGYGTQQNWMAVRQELLCYTRGKPTFNVQYTDIPKILRGYYKDINGQRTENSERSHSDCIRASNVWVDIQQVFYRMKENVGGCAAQKPVKAIERIINASSNIGDIVLDFFAHAGTTLIAAEQTERKCVTCDIDPIFAEITIRRLEHLRQTGENGWQMGHPFEQEMRSCEKTSVDQNELNSTITA